MTSKVNKFIEEPTFKSSTVLQKRSTKDSSHCLSDHTSDNEVSCLKNIKSENNWHRKSERRDFSLTCLIFRAMKKMAQYWDGQRSWKRSPLQVCKAAQSDFLTAMFAWATQKKRRDEDLSIKKRRKVCNQMSNTNKKCQ